MAWFGRRKRPESAPPSPPSDPDPLLPQLSHADADALQRLTQQAFAEHGIETVPDGARGLDAHGEVFGLSNLAAQAAQLPRGEWPELVHGHVRTMVAGDEHPDVTGLAEVRDRLYLRLRHTDQLPPCATGVAEALPGVQVMAAIDYPTEVRELVGDSAARLGAIDEVWAVGLANLRALPLPAHETLDADRNGDAAGSAVVHALSTEDFFGASRLLIVDELLARLGIPTSPHGLLVAVPERHLLVVHPITGPGVMASMQLMAMLARDECRRSPGAISPFVHHRPDPEARSDRVTRVDDDGEPAPLVSGRLADAVRALGLIDNP